MTVLRAVEEVKTIFPSLGHTQILEYLDSSQKMLSEEVGVLTDRGQLEDIHTNTAWALPANLIKLIDVVMYDTDNNPLYLGDYGYAYEIEFGNFYIYSKTSTPITGLDAGISTVYLEFTKKASTVNSLTSIFDIPEPFHNGILAGMYKKLFSLYPVNQVINGNIIVARDYRAAQNFEKEYRETRIRLKKYLNRDETHKEAINYPHAGAFELPRRNDAMSTLIQPINALSTIYNKYASWILTYPSAVTQSIYPVGFTGTITAAIANNQLTLTSSENEFANMMDWDANQEDIQTPIGGFSNTTWVFDLPLGDWGIIKFVIFQRI